MMPRCFRGFVAIAFLICLEADFDASTANGAPPENEDRVGALERECRRALKGYQ